MKALISVSDKTGVVDLAQDLTALGFSILSTGGTAKALTLAEISNQEVSNFTGSPEILGGRVKTLHPKIFGGILGLRGSPEQTAEMARHQIDPIDWVIVNLYPFEKMDLENKISNSEMIEFIDIGGVSLLRAAAKNFQDVVVLCDPADYDKVVQEHKELGQVSARTRRALAAKVFAHTAHYDSMIAKFFERNESLHSAADKLLPEETETFPQELSIGLRKISELRYGENPQQRAAIYQESGLRDWGIVHAEKLQGKELSFNNYLDLDAAWQLVLALSTLKLPQSKQSASNQTTACVIIKHTNPAGAAVGATPKEAFEAAYACDSLSAFGGIVGFSTTVDEQAAEKLTESFFECIVAPEYSSGALEIFKKKSNLRVLRQKIVLTLPYELDYKKISGGILIQQPDLLSDGELLEGRPESSNTTPGLQRILEKRTVMTNRKPTPEEIYAMELAWKVCKNVKSNAIVLGCGNATYGIGSGQMSRIDSLRIAVEKMNSRGPGLKIAQAMAASDKTTKVVAARTQPLVMASDAFFPFRDTVDEAAAVGVSAIIVPGGSIRDADSIQAANEHNIAMIFTGTRHFKH